MTTNNHPAHGPVSLDRLHQIREILSKAAAQSDGGNLCYAMADAVKVIAGVIAAFGAKPVAYTEKCEITNMQATGLYLRGFPDNSQGRDIALYTEPPAPVAMKDHQIRELVNDLRDIAIGYHGAQQLRERIARTIRAAMLQAGNFRGIQNSSTNNCREISETSTNEHEIETHTLLKSIEGMEVSVDVSTCDADAGHRYFGTVTEISELDTARNGYILLVQDAKPNFKPAGNSPATPDGWQLVPKEPTAAMNKAGWAAMNEHDAINPTYRAMLAAAPQQEVKSALEHGMQRYAGAMQKLSEGDK